MAFSFETPPEGAPTTTQTPEPPRPPAPPTLESSRELLDKCGLKVPLPAELEQALPIAEKLARIEAEEIHINDLEAKRRWDKVIAEYGPLVASGDLDAARKLATEAFFPTGEKQQHVCRTSLYAIRGKLRGELSAIVDRAFQRTATVVSKALTGFEAADRNYAFTSGFETVQYRTVTFTARAWPKFGMDAVQRLFTEALAAAPKK